MMDRKYVSKEEAMKVFPPNDELIEEWGSNGPINFLQPGQTKMYMENGRVALCKCGKAATVTMIGGVAYIARCYECAVGDSNEDS